MRFSHMRAVLAAGAAMLAMAGLAPVPAYAQFGGVVYDPTNYAQNVLTAARTLEQINNQIRQLQNQATSLVNEAKNLASLPTSVLEPLQQQIKQTQQLLGQAQRMAYDVKQIQTRFGQDYKAPDLTASQRSLVERAESRWQTSVAAFEDALKVQAGAVANIEGTRGAVSDLVTASQSATGALQAAQAGNQLLAVQSQQLADLIASVSAMGRAQTLDAADGVASRAQAREQLRRFLAPGRGYVATSARLFRN